MFESECFRAEDPQKTVCSALRPVGIMISGKDVQRFIQAVKNRLGERKFLIRSEFGHITRMNNKIDIVLRIDIGNGTPQIDIVVGITDVRIGYQCKSERRIFLLPDRNDRREKKDKNQYFFHIKELYVWE